MPKIQNYVIKKKYIQKDALSGKHSPSMRIKPSVLNLNNYYETMTGLKENLKFYGKKMKQM